MTKLVVDQYALLSRFYTQNVICTMVIERREMGTKFLTLVTSGQQDRGAFTFYFSLLLHRSHFFF